MVKISLRQVKTAVLIDVAVCVCEMYSRYLLAIMLLMEIISHDTNNVANILIYLY